MAKPIIIDEAADMQQNWRLIGILERFAEVARKQSQEDRDIRGKAYKAGKADGLSLASYLLRDTSRNVYARSGGLDQGNESHVEASA